MVTCISGINILFKANLLSLWITFVYELQWITLHCTLNQNDPGSNPTRHSSGLRHLTSLQSSGDLWIDYVKIQWFTSGEWSCLFDNGWKFVVGQSNSSSENLIIPFCLIKFLFPLIFPKMEVVNSQLNKFIQKTFLKM